MTQNNPFVAALDALFASSMAIEAVYTPLGGAAVAIRVIQSQPDAEVGFGDGRIVEGTDIFEVRRADVSSPARGDTITADGRSFSVAGKPMLDVEGLTWTIGAIEDE